MKGSGAGFPTADVFFRVRRTLASVILVSALMVATAGPAAGAQGSDELSLQEVRVQLQDYRIELDGVRVAPGAVRFDVVNAGPRQHNLRLQSPGVEGRTADLAPGERATLEVTFSSPGIYTVFCDVAYHHQKGMAAVLIVEDGSPAAAAAVMLTGGSAGSGFEGQDNGESENVE